jgi:hypothetical protein
MTDVANEPTKYQRWLDRWSEYARRTPQGTVMCFKINVNRAGHGYISHMTDKGKIDQTPPQHLADVEQAVQVLRDVWARAEELANRPQEESTQ